MQWGGAVHGSRASLVGTLRQTLLQLESSIPAALLHPNWAIHRGNWLRAVNMCTSPRDFSLALAILEASVKPVLFNAAWNDSLGEGRWPAGSRLTPPPVVRCNCGCGYELDEELRTFVLNLYRAHPAAEDDGGRTGGEEEAGEA